MFRPLAFTKTSAMLFASLLSITLVPELMTIFIRGQRLKPESQNPVSRFFAWLYDPVIRLALRWKWTALLINFAVVPLTVPLLFVIGSEFMPPLFEGSMLYMPTSPPGLSITEATRLLQIQDKLLRQFPEVERVFGTVGRGTTPTDNTPMGMVNTTVTLKPREEWRPGMTMEGLQAALGGENVTQTIEGRERYPVNVRYERDFRENIPALERVLVKTSMGAQIPLSQLAEITLTPGPAMIRDENAQLAGYVYLDVATRDIGGYVDQAKRAIAERLKLPPGYTLQWTGQYEFQVRARERLRILIPIVFFIIFMLLYMTFHSASEATIVMLSVIYAMTGGVILQWALGYNFSVAVWVGYIALYGVAVQTGVVMVVYLHEALDKRLRRGGEITERDVLEATINGSVLRLRPKLMTVSVVMASLIPIMWRTPQGRTPMVRDPGCGAQVNEEGVAWKTDYKGKTYWFCSAGCRKAFERKPERYCEAERHSDCAPPLAG